MTGAVRGRRKTVIGRVIGTRMAKTIVVEHVRAVQHPRFKKYLRRSTILKAHDEEGQARMGDQVELSSSRRVSKTKHWRLLRIVHRAAAAQEAGS